MHKLTKDGFIQKAILIHSNKYSYSKVIYKGSKDKICITCPVHGDFYQSPNVHLSGHGCPKCRSINMSNLLKSNLEEFIEKAILKHGNKYNYSKFIYVNNWSKGLITCPDHGDFEQIPNSHLSGHGCPKCKIENSINVLKSNKQEFTKKAKKVHGDKYNYDKVKYKSANERILITCHKHGDFEQTPGCHLFGQGCPKCGYEKNSEKFRSNTLEFIEKAKVIHGDLYDYSKVNYLTIKDKVTIICKKHGEFKQIASHHLSGSGCQICKSSKGELAIKEILDKYNIKYIVEYGLPEIINRLKYDFYLPDYRLLIGFHGKQHYERIPYFHKTEDDFLKQKTRDILKKDQVYRFKYKLLEFNYKQFKDFPDEQFENLVITRLNKIISNKAITFRFN